MTANLHATLGVTVRYTNEEGGTSAITPIAIACDYQGQNHGAVDVPDAETSATVHAIPFGAVAKATLAVVTNRTGQELEVTVNGVAATTNLAIGGTFVYGGASFPAAQALTSLSFKTTGSQSGAGSIGYHVFGDPA